MVGVVDIVVVGAGVVVVVVVVGLVEVVVVATDPHPELASHVWTAQLHGSEVKQQQLFTPQSDQGPDP